MNAFFGGFSKCMFWAIFGMKRYQEQRGTLVAPELEGPGSLAVGWWVGVGSRLLGEVGENFPSLDVVFLFKGCG